jgi:DNA-binding phage protein
MHNTAAKEQNGDYARAQKAIHEVSENMLMINNDMQLSRNKHVRHLQSFTEVDHDDLLKKEKEILKHLDDVRDAKDNADLTIQTNNIAAANLHLSSANNSMGIAKSLLENYKKIITDRIQERTAKL